MLYKNPFRSFALPRKNFLILIVMASAFSLIALFLLFNFGKTIFYLHFSSVLFLFFKIYLFILTVSSTIILEEGYTVTTVIDGHELKINPHSVIARPGSSDLLILDFSSSHLYTVSFPLSSGTLIPPHSSTHLLFFFYKIKVS